jgi:hypothetical protein
MNDPRLPESARQHPARRDVLRLFGLTAAGVMVGAYTAPAMASFRPPAAFIGSSEVSFVPVSERTIACDGPAMTTVAVALYSVNSTSFRGRVRFALQPTTPTSGWIYTIDKQEVQVNPGDQVFVKVALDCYGDPQVGAEPQHIKLRVTATGYPADASPSFVIGTLPAQALCVQSRLQVTLPQPLVVVPHGTEISTTAVVSGELIDSAAFGPVKLSASLVPGGGTVALSVDQLAFQGNGSFPVQVRVRMSPAVLNGTASVRLVATLDHASFAAPMVAEQSFTVQVTR